MLLNRLHLGKGPAVNGLEPHARVRLGLLQPWLRRSTLGNRRHCVLIFRVLVDSCRRIVYKNACKKPLEAYYLTKTLYFDHKGWSQTIDETSFCHRKSEKLGKKKQTYSWLGGSFLTGPGRRAEAGAAGRTRASGGVARVRRTGRQ